MENIVTTRLTNAVSLTRAISPEHFGCLPGLSADDALFTLLTPAKAGLRVPIQPLAKFYRPSILNNDIEGAFN